MKSLQVGEGPIALILEPTRELAAQTHAVSQQFCSRTAGEDLIRAGVVFGGVACDLQTPLEGAPDYGRWPELLVATPGRLWELMTRRCWISAKRMSYVVLDEADHMLETGTWLMQITELLRLLRKDRQLLLFSATLPQEAERAALDLCGDELIKIQVNPKVPNITQEVKLFKGSFDGGYDNKMQELLRWIREDLKPEEALLLLCHKTNMGFLAADKQLEKAISDITPDSKRPVAFLDHHLNNGQSPYKDFVRGATKALIATFALGGRGLDFNDTTSDSQLSLAVVLFDFPSNMGEYAHCIGRTARPGQKAGRVYAFFPEGRFWMAGELIRLLEHCEQTVPQSLQDIYTQDAAFMAEMKGGMQQLLAGNADAGTLPEGTYDAEKQMWSLPCNIPSHRRKLIHSLADELSLPHVSVGYGDRRQLVMARERQALPEKFFLEGEAVCVVGREGQRDAGVVKDPRVKRGNITVCFHDKNVFGHHPTDVPVEFVWVEGQEIPEHGRSFRSYQGWRNYASYNKGYR